MGLQGIFFIVGIFVLIAVVVWGAFTRHRLIVVSIFSAFLMLIALLGSWYAIVETHSLAWGLGYGMVAIFSLAVAIKHLLPAQQQV